MDRARAAASSRYCKPEVGRVALFIKGRSRPTEQNFSRPNIARYVVFVVKNVFDYAFWEENWKAKWLIFKKFTFSE
jgi:hypothetical protein